MCPEGAWDARTKHATESRHERVVRLAHACSSTDDHADPGCGRGMAAVCAGLRGQPLLPSADYFLDHPGHAAFDSAALATAGAVAPRVSGRQRRIDGFRVGVRHRAAGKLLHFVVPAGDHCGQHSVFAERGVRHRGDVPGAAGGDGRPGVYRQDSAHLRGAGHSGKPAHLVPEQFIWIPGGRLPGEFIVAVAAPQRRGAGRKAGRVAGPAGFHRRHRAFHARRIADDGLGRAHPAAEPHRRGYSGIPFRKYSRTHGAGN